MKIGWGGKSFFTDYIVGAADYDSGKASSISGITADDSTGQITIQLTKPYGAFDNVLAFPAAGLVPSGTPMNDLGNSPPPGVGSYSITNVVPNQSFTLQKNSRFDIPGIPQGHLQTIKVNVTSNTLTEAQQVLNNQADNFDAGDTVPPTLLNQIQSSASNRFAKETAALTFYFFMNTTTKPFNDPMAREAVNLALGETRSPRRQYVDYYTNVLNELGFHATEQILQDSVYFTTIGNASTNPQTGFADWSQDFPNPSDFYLLLDGTAIQPVKNQNFSKVNDPQIQAQLATLNPVPATQLSSVASQWQALDQYTAKQNYEAVYGYEQVPKFMSNRINFNSAVFSPMYYNDWSSWQLNS
jgi:peptide/nickel transport system substrate-binding protein